MLRASVILALVTLLASGCDGPPCDQVLCGPCESPVTILVRDSAGEPIADVATDSPDFSCVTGGCSGGASSGNYALTISAPGFIAQEVEVTVPARAVLGCCGCPYEPQTVTVTLQPE